MRLRNICTCIKSIGLVCASLLLSISISAQTDNPAYNKALADSLGGDDYGRKMDVLVILKTGPVKPELKETVDV